MIKKALSRYFCHKFYPTKSKDWYVSKGYAGRNDQEIFEHFIRTQQNKKLKREGDISSKFFDDFQRLDFERIKISSGLHTLDGVIISNSDHDPIDSAHNLLPGHGITIIMFQGRCEYYESRFRDMALFAKHTGARVLGFNPKGFHSSTGDTRILKDIVDDGVAVVEYLLKQNISPSSIIMLGNSLGGAVQEMVCKRLKKEKSISGFRQINSNSFRSLSSLMAHKFKVPALEKIFYKILSYSGWEIDVDEDFYITGPMRLCLKRYGDKTILPGASYHSTIDKKSDLERIKNSYEAYVKDYEHLSMHSELTHKSASDRPNIGNKEDPHMLSMNQLISTNQKDFSVFDIINYYISASNRFIQK